MPGLIGDALYALPTIRHISKIMGEKVDFWTSKRCSPMLSLVKSQSYINDAYLAENYVEQHSNCGLQPWLLEVEKPYDRIYNLGLQSYPQCRLVDYYGQLHGFTLVDTTIKYDLPELNIEPGIAICPGRNPLLKGIFSDIINYFYGKKPIYLIGPKSELICGKGIIVSGDLLAAAQYISKCPLFFGTLSSSLVLANGFDCKKIVICEKERRNPVHDIMSDKHYYIDFPTDLNKILECVDFSAELA